MATDKQLDQAISGWLEAEAPGQLPDRVLRATFERTRTTRQHRRGPAVLTRSLDTMNKLVPIAAGVAAVAVAAVIGSQLLGTGGAGGTPSAGPTPTPPPSTSPGASPGTALTETFTSERNGFSIAYPAGWVTRPATTSWTSGVPDFLSTHADVLSHPALEGNLWIAVASQPLAGTGGAQWVDDLLAEGGSIDECGPPGDAVTVDGAAGRWCGDQVVAVSSGDRGYVIRLYTSGDDPAAVAPYDRAWFEEVLATVQLLPGDAR